MLYLFLGMVLTGCGLMITAAVLPIPFPTADHVHGLGTILAVIGAMGTFFIWQAATS